MVLGGIFAGVVTWQVRSGPGDVGFSVLMVLFAVSAVRWFWTGVEWSSNGLILHRYSGPRHIPWSQISSISKASPGLVAFAALRTQDDFVVPLGFVCRQSQCKAVYCPTLDGFLDWCDARVDRHPTTAARLTIWPRGIGKMARLIRYGVVIDNGALVLSHGIQATRISLDEIESVELLPVVKGSYASVSLRSGASFFIGKLHCGSGLRRSCDWVYREVALLSEGLDRKGIIE